MPKIIKDINEKKVSLNISLPNRMIAILDSCVDEMKAEFGSAIPKTFSRSELMRICIDRMIVHRYRLPKGTELELLQIDALKCEVMREYGIMTPQLDLFNSPELEEEILANK